MEGNLLDFILDLVKTLMLNTHFDGAALRHAVDNVRNDLESMAAQYDTPAPKGAEAVRELMLECIQLYDQALEQVTVFLGDDDEEHLQLAVQLAEEANDVLSLVEELIQNNKNILSEMVEA